MEEKKVLLATYPFGTTGKRPVELLERTNYKLVSNPYRRRLKPNDVAELLCGIEGVIACLDLRGAVQPVRLPGPLPAGLRGLGLVAAGLAHGRIGSGAVMLP